MLFNPLPEFVEENGGFTPVDLDIEDDFSDDPHWLRKIQYRVGAVVIEFNALEQVVDEAILDLMNEHAEDSRVWVFLETMLAAKKIGSLFRIYGRNDRAPIRLGLPIDVSTRRCRRRIEVD